MKILPGNIFDTECETIVNPVNTIGLMGTAHGWDFKIRFPQAHLAYIKSFREGTMKIGTLNYSRNLELDPNTNKSHNILNFPTKDNLIGTSNITHIEAGLKKFVDNYKTLELKSIAFPILGIKPGTLKLKECQELMQKYLENIDLNIEIYLPE